MAEHNVPDKYIMTEEERKGQCCNTCKSWKKGFVTIPDRATGEDKKVEVMLCKSPRRAAQTHTPPNDWCGWWEN